VDEIVTVFELNDNVLSGFGDKFSRRRTNTTN